MSMYRDEYVKRKDYREQIELYYGAVIEEYRTKDGQKCGYFHITFPIFTQSQAIGEPPVGFEEPVTVYTETAMKSMVINRIFKNEWYMKMCEAWKEGQNGQSD